MAKRRKVRYGRLMIVMAVCLLIVFFIVGLLVKTYQVLFKVDDLKVDTVQKETIPDELQKRVDDYLKMVTDISKEDALLDVKMNMDLEPYSQITIVDDDSNMAMLINKFYALPEGYEPDDLIYLDTYACDASIDYGCQADIQLRKEAYDHFLEWCKAAKKEIIDMQAISGYRSYEYQDNLWTHNAQESGEEYADAYFARAGQSEHNTGLCVDIMFDGHDFNEIENYEGYDWILKHAHEYGFILRYPEDKVDITRYNYESWHFRYVGKDIATKCYENDWCLEQYWAKQ